MEILLGRDFLELHKHVIFQFDGGKDDLVVSKADRCAVAVAKVETPSLFANLVRGWKPIATKSRRFNQIDKEFISQTLTKWRLAGTVRPSKSPWRAQCVVVKQNGQAQRLAIDYSQTINLFTEKDGFPIPLIEELVNDLASYKFFASYDLRKAYHQIPIAEKDKPMTAFEACGQLWEFNVIPFGVTNGGPVFQRIMTQMVKEDRLVNVFVYFDNVIVAAQSLKDLELRSAQFKKSMDRRSMTLNESKTVYGVPQLNILGYCVGAGMIKPDPDRLKPLLELPAPTSQKSLKRILGLFAYYARWVPKFSDRICRLKSAQKFPLSQLELEDFQKLKRTIAAAALQFIDESLPFTVECDASEVAVSATLNQNDRPVAFMSRSLSGSELAYPSIEKEATAIIEAVRKWQHLLIRQHFVLVTDQRSVAFMLDARKRTKIKNNKIMCWRLELASFSYTIRYRPGKLNVGPDTLTRASCGAISVAESRLMQLHKELCCPGVMRFWHFVRSKNFPYSLDEIKKCCSTCPTCAEVKPQFHVMKNNTLIKATHPMERLNIDFKGPLPSVSRNCYFMCIVDEYSRYPFCFACPDTSAVTVIGCLERVFSLFGTCNYVHSDRGSAFMSKRLRDYLLQKGIASSRTTPYNPMGNAQCERYNGIIWKAVKCVMKSQDLPLSKWEIALPAALSSIRALLCTATGDTPHSRFLSFSRRSQYGKSLPDWLCTPGPVLLRKFVRAGKNDDLVQRVDLVEANPMYARIKYPDGRESNVSLRDLARCPRSTGETADDESVERERNFEIPLKSVDARDGVQSEQTEARGGVQSEQTEVRDLTENSSDHIVDGNNDLTVNEPTIDNLEPRRSMRSNRGVPPDRYGGFVET